MNTKAIGQITMTSNVKSDILKIYGAIQNLYKSPITIVNINIKNDKNLNDFHIDENGLYFKTFDFSGQGTINFSKTISQILKSILMTNDIDKSFEINLQFTDENVEDNVFYYEESKVSKDDYKYCIIKHNDLDINIENLRNYMNYDCVFEPTLGSRYDVISAFEDIIKNYHFTDYDSKTEPFNWIMHLQASSDLYKERFINQLKNDLNKEKIEEETSYKIYWESFDLIEDEPIMNMITNIYYEFNKMCKNN